MNSLIKKLTDIDVLSEGQNEEWFVGRPFYLDYRKANILVSDYWKNKVKGIPQGTFLLAFYYNPFDDQKIEEAILLRALQPTKLPTESTIITSMIEYYKDNLKTTGKESDLDDFTKYEFSFSGLECSVLGSFYRTYDRENKSIIEFGADLENFYSAHNYKVFKIKGDVLARIVNQRDSELQPGNVNEFPLGVVRYSSSRRFQNEELNNIVPVWISPSDILGKRTALFGMTRTGKSNTVKKIIEASVQISDKSSNGSLITFERISQSSIDNSSMKPLGKDGAPKFEAGQIIFDINGEYANKNLQDGTAIFEMFENRTIRYSILDKQNEGFKLMKVNFYADIETGFEYICSSLAEDSGDYITGFTVVNLEEPSKEDRSAYTRYLRKKSVYLCCLHRAGFAPPAGLRIQFEGNADLNAIVDTAFGNITPNSGAGIEIEDAINWWTEVWKNRDHDFFANYKRRRRKEWIDEELSALLTFLTRRKSTGHQVSGYTKLKKVLDLHTNQTDSSFQIDILSYLRNGQIVIVDLSQGSPSIQRILSERICQEIFKDSMRRFTKAKPNNFIQFYFEEAHNLFPKKEDKDLSQIYNRLAKEGAKLNLGMLYATQEVSSISSNILKNTQNWFIAHLNNEDELKELRKYYDFSDFTDSLIRFSAKNDKGFVRMKTYSNPFVVPVQIDLFEKKD